MIPNSESSLVSLPLSSFQDFCGPLCVSGESLQCVLVGLDGASRPCLDVLKYSQNQTSDKGVHLELTELNNV